MTSDSQKSSARPRQNNDGAAPAWVLELWERSGGKPWEPPDPLNKHVLWLIDNGFVRRVDGRCGFEAFKDSMLAWTTAGKLALNAGAEDYYPSHELLTEIVSLESEYQVLNGGGPGWAARWADAIQRACAQMEGE